MSQSSEQIEAKLCAYLEGELDEQGRAEIEKHLAANPAHRKLLAEVAGTRDLLRGLPREAAPADLCETLQGHLERSVLLDDAPDAHAHSAMRIGRWRPLLAMAAMVVLAVGLGLVIYFGLPGAVQHQGSVNYAKNTKGTGPAPDESPEGHSATQLAETGRNEKDRVTDAEQQVAEGLPGQGKGQPSGQDGQQYARGGSFGGGMGGATRAMQPPGSAGLAPTAGEAERLNAVAQGTESKVSTDSLQELAQQVPKLWSPEAQRALFYRASRTGGAAGPANPALYLVVASAAPAVTSQQVTEELARLDLKFETVAVPVTEGSAAEPPTPEKKALSDSAYALGAGEGAEMGTELNALKKAKETQRPAPGPQRVPAERNALAGVAGRDAAADRFNAPESRSAAGASASATPPAAPAATSPAAGTLAERAEDPLAADKVANADAAPAAPAPAPAAEPGAAPADAGVRSETLYVARNVTRRQAELLRASLGQNRGEGEVALWSAQPDGSVAPASVLRQELSVAETKSDTDAAAVVPSTTPSAVAQNPDLRERVALRSAREEVGEVRAQSESQDQIRRQRYSEPAPSGGRGAPPARGLATAPAVAKQADLGRAQRQTGVNEAQVRQDEKLTMATTAAPAPAGETPTPPSKLGVAQSGPTTSPDTAGKAEDERVDLVILVRKPDAAGSAGAAGGPIEKHEILTITLGDDDATNVRVAEDGTVDLPTVGKVAAEGLTAEELGKKLTMSLGRAKAGAKVTVTRPSAPGASTRPETRAAQDSPKPDDAAPVPDGKAEKAPQPANKSDSGGQ